MNTNSKRIVCLNLQALPAYLPIVTQTVASSAGVFGLGKADCLSLELAVEEIFQYLCNSACPGNELKIECLDGIYYTQATFRFSASGMNLRGLNIAPSVAFNYEGECDLSEMGLLLASRSVDHLHVTIEKGNLVSLSVVKEKTYPRISDDLPLPETSGQIKLETPDPERLKQFCLLVGNHYSEQERPSFFDHPGKVVDMVAGGDYQCLVAMNPRKAVVGGILHFSRTEKIVQCYGPYLFQPDQETDTGAALLNACLGRIARGRALGLLSISGLPHGLEANFEPLGDLNHYRNDVTPIKRSLFYRHLHEDPGGEVWSHAGLLEYLERAYERLVLARDIRVIRDMSETRAGYSLFAADVNRERSEVTLRPLLPGADFAANVERHIRFLSGERFRNLFFELDLGVPWHAELIPVIIARGFKPEIVLPFAGQSDLIVFQYHDAAQS